jgi:hypothetical protein
MKEFLSLPKPVLFRKLTQQYNFDRLHRAESRQNRLTGMKKKAEEVDVKAESVTKKQKVEGTSHTIVNTLDPIMLGALKKHTFKFARTKDVAVLFNVDSLVDWCISTGDFSDPETRIPFSDEDLKEIDRAVDNLILHMLRHG